MDRNFLFSNWKKQLYLVFFVLLIGSASFSQTSIFPATSTPASLNNNDGQALEIGVKFRSTQAGYITGLRFYKGSSDNGTHIGHLWSSTGTKLAEITFTGESASGWQQMLFTTPVAITANTTYVASYFSGGGYYVITNPYFSSATTNAPLTALANGTDGGNGVYIYTAASAFPNNTYQTSNYWVDVLYVTSIGPDATPPTVSLTAPAAGNVSGTITVSANATDNIGVTGVQFLLDGVNLGTEDLVSPYSISWNTTTVTNGNHTLTARARDAAGNTTTSTSVAVTVNNDVTAPTVSMTAPAAGNVTGTISVSATASDNIGVAGVQFLLDGAALGAEDVATPFSISWNTATTSNGSHTLTARARDAAGNTTTSAGVVVTVNNAADLTAPTVSLTAPAAGTVSGTINVTATATDNVAVSGVQFLLNGANLGTEDVSSPYSISWNTATVANGTYTLTARARDAAGNTTTSASIVVTVSNTTLLTALPMNETSGTTTADISGYNHPGTLVNNPARGAGKYGQGLTFNGTNSYVNIPDHNDYTLDPAQSYTWSAWVKNTSFKEWSTVWSQTASATTFFYFYAHTTTDGDGGPVTNGISVYWWNSNTVKLGAHSSNNVLTAGTWSYVAVTYDASQPQNNRFTIYVNGVDVTVRTDVSSNGTIASINPTNVRVGSNAPFGEYLNGSVDEVRFYKKLLSAAEIQTDMNTPLEADNIAPTVSLTAPVAGNVSGTINVDATASDNVAVAGVQFLLDGANLGAEDLASPYTISWNTTTASNGNHTLTAKARDASGNTTTSAPIIVSVNNDVTAPTVSISAPVAGDVSGTININATASDNTGVAGVQFLLDGVNLGAEDVLAPYTISWNTTTVTDGNHTLTAKARDAAGNITTSAGVIVNVSNDTQAPTVNITAPVAGNVSGTISITATASDNAGVTGVQFQLDGINLGAEDLVSPYTISWNTTTSTNGNHTLTAIARDASGNVATSAGIIVTVNNDVTDPTVSITAPTAGPVTGTISVSANASDNIGVAGVQFQLDGVNLGTEDIASPYTISWNTATTTNGNHTLTAIARDAAGNTTTSAGVIVSVTNDSQAPTVSITAPAAGNVSGTINVTANASDNIGVVGVQFLLDGVNLGTEDLASPYSVSWNTTTATNGNHTLTARARDAAGNITTSAGVIVNVSNDSQAPTVSITSPAAGNVAGTINVTATASDNIGVAGVQFLLDGVNLGAEDVASPFSVAWTTTSVTDGSHTLTARARDAAGNTTTSAAVIVNVHNDAQAPTVSITAPAAGNVSGTINVTANAADNNSVAGVQFLLDGANLGTEDVASPYSISWNTQTMTNGAHTLSARARDASGNVTTSAVVNVNVLNNSSLIAALNLNEGAGTAALDISGNSHNGTLASGPTWGTGKYGQAVNFDGANDYINIPAHADFSLDPAQSYTWSAWVKNTNFNEWGPVWSQTVDVNNFFYFYAHTSGDLDGGPVTNGVSVYWWTNGGTNKIGVHSSNNVLTAGIWSHIAVTYDGSQPQNNRFTIYVNGADVTVRTDVSSTGTLGAINSTNIRIGSDQPFNEFLNGSIDEVRVYKRALSAAEVQTDMNTPIVNGIAPMVTPANSANNVSLNTALTAVFNVDMNATTISGSTFELRDASNVLVPAVIAYNSSNRTATLTPTSALLPTAIYTAKIKGGATGVKDALGNIMNSDYSWNFTTLDPASLPITEGPGGPILVISSTASAFSRFPVEILRAEGLNEFAAADISSVTSTMLNNYDVVILGEMTVTASQVTMFTNWVNAGGTLIAFRPSSLLTPLMGLSSSTGTLSDKYLLVNTASGPGVGIVNQTIQYHGAANLHTLSGATSLATLYSTSSAATTNPAVTTINVGTNGGKAIAFTYDLAKSIIYTRQGNPSAAGVETDGQSPVRPDDLFYPTYVDMNKIAIPQADEQQRLLANIIIQSNLAKKPLPRFWYLPSGYKAAVIYALDDHGTASATTTIFNKMIANSTSGCSVDNWECLRATSWYYVGIPLTNSQAVNYYTQGFDMGVHVENGCNNFSSFNDLNNSYNSQLATFANTYPGLPAQIGHRFHCLVWSDWLTQAKVELSHNMRFSLDYYYWPSAWINGRPGLFTGSGMPMRFADTDGSMIDIYQGVSQLVNENGINYTTDINTLLDNALGSTGYYGMFGTHDDFRDGTYSDVTIASAKSRNVPIISVKQALTWLDGRNNSSFGNMSWSNNQLTFSVTARSNARNLRAMLPVNSQTGALVSITRNGISIAFTVQTIKGIQYAFFAPVTGTSTYVATYGSGTRFMNNAITKENTAIETQPAEMAQVKATPEEIATVSKLTVNVAPNPSSGNFNIRINSNDENPVTVKITDMFGRLIETREKVTSSVVLKLGQYWKSGIYFAEVTQGGQKEVVKMVKTN